MCGLVGVVGKIGLDERKVFKRLLELDTVRGPHSTGFLRVGADGSSDVFKGLGTPWDVFKKEINPFGKLSNAGIDFIGRTNVLLMGHNRYATMGAINAENAHPFIAGDIVGAHNGTLKNQSLLDNHQDYEVDSENVFNHMDANGIDDTIAKLYGAYTLTYYNKKEETFNFIRNNERPLFFTYSEDRKTLFYASEEWMLYAACGVYGVVHSDVIKTLPSTLYTFDIPYFKPKKAQVIEGKQRFIAEYEPPKRDWGSRYYDYPSRRTGGFSKSGVTKNDKRLETLSDFDSLIGKTIRITILGSTTDENNDMFLEATYDECMHDVSILIPCEYNSRDWVRAIESFNTFEVEVAAVTFNGGSLALKATVGTLVEIDSRIDMDSFLNAYSLGDEHDDTDKGLLYGYNKEMISEEEFNKQTSCGCASCSADILPADDEDIFWVSRDTVLCHSCSRDLDSYGVLTSVK